MDTWKVGQKLICDRFNRCALVTEVCEMRRGTYATLYNPANHFCLVGAIDVLQAHGWRSADS